jgi:hypothetical protein
MATVEQCEQALHELANRLAEVDAATRAKTVLDRSVSCEITDLGAHFAARLRDGGLHDIELVTDPKAQPGQIRLAMSGDDLVALAADKLNFASAWASGRLKVQASVMDLFRLRNLF